MVCGSKKVDIELLQRFSKYQSSEVSKEDTVKWFWSILDEMEDVDKINFIKFSYAQERLPSNSEEYEKLGTIFTVKLNTSLKDTFPKADTCFFSVELPIYSSKEKMKERLLGAIRMDNVSINRDNLRDMGNLQAYDEEEE